MGFPASPLVRYPKGMEISEAESWLCSGHVQVVEAMLCGPAARPHWLVLLGEMQADEGLGGEAMGTEKPQCWHSGQGDREPLKVCAWSGEPRVVGKNRTAEQEQPSNALLRWPPKQAACPEGPLNARAVPPPFRAP